jgi:hypothetical protein
MTVTLVRPQALTAAAEVDAPEVGTHTTYLRIQTHRRPTDYLQLTAFELENNCASAMTSTNKFPSFGVCGFPPKVADRPSIEA